MKKENSIHACLLQRKKNRDMAWDGKGAPDPRRQLKGIQRGGRGEGFLHPWGSKVRERESSPRPAMGERRGGKLYVYPPTRKKSQISSDLTRFEGKGAGTITQDYKKKKGGGGSLSHFLEETQPARELEALER